MIRFVFSFVVISLVAAASAFAQPGGTAKVGCFEDTTRDCQLMALNAQPQATWKRCTQVLCKPDPFDQGILVCLNNFKGLKQTNEGPFLDVEPVEPDTQGRSNVSSVVSPFACGEIWSCSCDGRAEDQTCVWGANQNQDYHPVEWSTFGGLNCWG